MERRRTNAGCTTSRDHLTPSTVFSEAVTENIGKYGCMRQNYLQEHRSRLYNSLLLSGKLQAHLLEINHKAHKRLEQMMPELAKEAGATKRLKASDPLKWVGLMNTCKAQAEEIILSELVYS